MGKPVETQELANRIARESTVSPADTHAMFRALLNIMADFIKESRAVHLGGLGWFRYIAVSAGNGVVTKEEVSRTKSPACVCSSRPTVPATWAAVTPVRFIADEGITFMEWLGKESDETQVPEKDDDEGQTENSMG